MLKGFITNLGKYNEGELVGEWIEFPIDEDALQEVFERIGINEEYEEFFFTDWECEFDADLGEYESIDSLNELAEALDGEDKELVSAIVEATGYSLAEALKCTYSAIFYKNMTMIDVAYQLVEELYSNGDDFLLRYFDYDALARDLAFDGYCEVSNGVVVID